MAESGWSVVGAMFGRASRPEPRTARCGCHGRASSRRTRAVFSAVAGTGVRRLRGHVAVAAAAHRRRGPDGPRRGGCPGAGDVSKDADLLRLGAPGALDDPELDAGAHRQGVVFVGFDRGLVDEDVGVPAVLGDEAVALFLVVVGFTAPCAMRLLPVTGVSRRAFARRRPSCPLPGASNRLAPDPRPRRAASHPWVGPRPYPVPSPRRRRCSSGVAARFPPPITLMERPARGASGPERPLFPSMDGWSGRGGGARRRRGVSVGGGPGEGPPAATGNRPCPRHGSTPTWSAVSPAPFTRGRARARSTSGVPVTPRRSTPSATTSPAGTNGASGMLGSGSGSGRTGVDVAVGSAATPRGGVGPPAPGWRARPGRVRCHRRGRAQSCRVASGAWLLGSGRDGRSVNRPGAQTRRSRTPQIVRERRVDHDEFPVIRAY